MQRGRLRPDGAEDEEKAWSSPSSPVQSRWKNRGGILRSIATGARQTHWEQPKEEGRFSIWAVGRGMGLAAICAHPPDPMKKKARDLPTEAAPTWGQRDELKDRQLS